MADLRLPGVVVLLGLPGVLGSGYIFVGGARGATSEPMLLSSSLVIKASLLCFPGLGNLPLMTFRGVALVLCNARHTNQHRR